MRDSDVHREIDNMTGNRTNNMNREAGKGSRPRPFDVAQEQYEARWDMIFGRDKGDKERDFKLDKREEALAEVQRLGQDIQPEDQDK
jgi:hypothetical protein